MQSSTLRTVVYYRILGTIFFGISGPIVFQLRRPLFAYFERKFDIFRINFLKYLVWGCLFLKIGLPLPLKGDYDIHERALIAPRTHGGLSSDICPLTSAIYLAAAL